MLLEWCSSLLCTITHHRNCKKVATTFVCAHLVTNHQVIDDPTFPPLHHALRKVKNYQQHYPYNTPLFLGFLVPPCCLNSGSVDVAFRFREERWHGASVSLPCENDDGDNRAAACASATSSSSITTAFHRRRPGLLCFPTCCTTTASPGFRSTRDSAETSRSFTLTIDCTSCQKIRSSNLGELFPTHFIKTAPVGFVAMLYFTSPRMMSVGSHPLWRSWITSTSSCFPVSSRIILVSYPYHTRIMTRIIPVLHRTCNSLTCT